MLSLIAFSAFAAQQGQELAFRLDKAGIFIYETPAVRYRSGVLYVNSVRLKAKEASQSLELSRSGGFMVVRFVPDQPNAGSSGDSLELPIVGDKPFTISYDPTSKHYRIAH